MFCPTCGKDNSLELKFCASCGTDLEAVSHALAGREEDFFTRIDTGIDFLIGRYSEHVFKNAPQVVSDRSVRGSWQLLGQAVLTSFIDIILFFLMWNMLPLRFVLLVISTPFRILAERHRAGDDEKQIEQGYKPPELERQKPGLWLGEATPSVTENTTQHLDSSDSHPDTAPVITGQFE